MRLRFLLLSNFLASLPAPTSLQAAVGVINWSRNSWKRKGTKNRSYENSYLHLNFFLSTCVRIRWCWCWADH